MSTRRRLVRPTGPLADRKREEDELVDLIADGVRFLEPVAEGTARRILDAGYGKARARMLSRQLGEAEERITGILTALAALADTADRKATDDLGNLNDSDRVVPLGLVSTRKIRDLIHDHGGDHE
jgi:regulator of protease activity HflC (stomatin/prohibitin superfamily)